MYIPGHAGIRYNERADRLAGGTVPFGNLEMTAADVVDSVTRSIHAKEELGEHTWCMHRLWEKEIKRGEGAHVSLRVNQRHIATQLTTGAMSKAGLDTLLEMLGGRGHGTHQTNISYIYNCILCSLLSSYILIQ
jgi:hypothetical protein